MKRIQRKKTLPGTQYTIRGIPPRLDRVLRQKAKLGGKSLNQVLMDALTHGSGLKNEPVIYHDLDFLAGSWIDDTAVECALKEQRRVDPKDWQ